MQTRSARLALGSAVGAALSVALPLTEVKLACARPVSEACVWGKALITVNVAGHFLVIGLPTAFLVSWLLGRRRGGETPPAAGPKQR